jgi:hypothetical protein
VLVGVAVAVALLAVGGLVGASFVKSPQQLAVEAAAPPATVIMAAVAPQVLKKLTRLAALLRTAKAQPFPRAGRLARRSRSTG